MAQFRYKAVASDGKTVKGVLDGASLDAIATALLRDGMTPLAIDPASAGETATGDRQSIAVLFKRRAAQDKIAEFTRELSIMLTSSVPLDRSLSVLQNLKTDEQMKNIIADVLKRVRGGAGLADAFAEHPEFSEFYISMVRAGESSGALEATLARLAEYMERSKALRSTISSALMYPAILLTVAVGSLIILLGFVVPKFADMFNDMGGTLPAPTQIVMAAGDWVANYWWMLTGIIALVVVGTHRWLQVPKNRLWVDRQLLNFGLTGDLVRKIETARLAHTLSTLLQGGVVLVNALSIGLATVGNRILRADLERGVKALKEGGRLSTSLIEDSQFPPLAMHMIQVGEETGQLEPILVKVANIYDDEVSTAVKRMLSLLEPVLILSLGVLIAGIIISIMVGIMSVNELVF